MLKPQLWTLTSALLVLGLIVGCSRSDDNTASLERATDRKSGPAPYFQTPFQDESQFIVETIASDLAEQVFYARHHRLPDPKQFSVSATEKPGSSLDAPVYQVEIRLETARPALHNEVSVNGPIWSPEVYRDLTAALAREAGLEPSGSHDDADGGLLLALTDARAITIEQENQKLSRALEKDFSNPSLHERAAVLLGAFMLREHSGHFFEIRSPLCRLTAHLAMARQLAGETPLDVNGEVAEAMLLTLVNNQAAALQKVESLKTNRVAVIEWVRTLEADNSGDYRPLNGSKLVSRLERIAWFRAYAGSVDDGRAWLKLDDHEKATPDFIRIASEHRFSVQMGHQLLELSVPADLREFATVYRLSHADLPKTTELANVLNQMPERCFDPGGKVQVINWGLWAMFFQRQLCHAIENNFDFMQNHWGVPDEARQFSAQCDRTFGGLRLYPFVRRFNCTDVAAYHSAVDDAFKVTVATPQLTPVKCWNYLCYRPPFAERYLPNPNPHVNEWHYHNPPPGTAYNLEPRLDHPSLVSRRGAAEKIAWLTSAAPYDQDLTDYIFRTRYHRHLTYEQAEELYRPVLDYQPYPMRLVAETLGDQPERYEKLMTAVSELEPGNYYILADYFLSRQQEDKVARYYEKAIESDSDAVRMSNCADWLVKYYVKTGQIQKAQTLADSVGEVYSFSGLQTKAEFLESTGKYPEAFDWYAKIQERYDDFGPLTAFCRRYKARTGDSRFDEELKRRVTQVFPRGIEKATLASFKSSPADGVYIAEENDLVRGAGLRAGDIIVAVYGIRVHNFKQYGYGRSTTDNPELDLTVWQHGSYHEVKASPPGHRFGANFIDYPAN